MPGKLRIAYLAHTLRSDWNNGNAHFLRGLLRTLGSLGHEVTAFEPEPSWSVENLRQEQNGEQSLAEFRNVYPDLHLELYRRAEDEAHWRERLRGMDAVILHEWNEPELARLLLRLREELGFALLFHDTHHRASSSPEQIAAFQLERFDGVLAFGEALRTLYRERYGLTQVWTFHEAADTTVFKPFDEHPKTLDVVWIGNWGEGERSCEIREYLLDPLAKMSPRLRATIYGVRYPAEGLDALAHAGVRYGGYLPNLHAPGIYAGARMTAHIPRQQYTQSLEGIPTIRVFEALACGIPLLSAPWRDTEGLFREGDLQFVHSCREMHHAMERLLREPAMAAEQAARGRDTVLLRHTCRHRAEQLTGILEELRA